MVAIAGNRIGGILFAIEHIKIEVDDLSKFANLFKDYRPNESFPELLPIYGEMVPKVYDNSKTFHLAANICNSVRSRMYNDGQHLK